MQSQKITTAWQSESIETALIRRTLVELWTDWETQNPDLVVATVATSAEQVYMRPSTVNVIVAVDTEADANRAAKIISRLPDYAASRSLILVRNAFPASKRSYSVEIGVEERMSGRGVAPVRQESIIIRSPAGHDEALASITPPLLIPDLPDVLYVPFGPIAGNELVESLFELVDNLVVDTVWSRDVGSELAILVDPATRQDVADISDIVWTRLAVWRQLVAQFFDQPTALPCLDAVEEVAIVYAPANSDGRNGLTAGLLVAGWLATRLGWRAHGELFDVRGAWRSTLRSGERGKSREIVLTLTEGSAPFSCSSIERVQLVSGPAAPGLFTVTRADEEGISTTSNHATGSEVTRLVLSGCPEDRFLVSQELRHLHEDPTYIEALEFASLLWPSGADR